MDPLTVYKKIWECDGSDVVHEFDDMTAVRGFDYYYYIQSKDDGSTEAGKVLKSGMFWTVTSVPANLKRPSVPDTPKAPANDSNSWALMSSQGEWVSGSDYDQYDAVSYNNFTYVCIVTHTGDTVTTTPDINIINWRVTTFKGEWVSGAGYHAYDVVTYHDSRRQGTGIGSRGSEPVRHARQSSSIWRRFPVRPDRLLRTSAGVHGQDFHGAGRSDL
jgi:hypothetical protein